MNTNFKEIRIGTIIAFKTPETPSITADHPYTVTKVEEDLAVLILDEQGYVRVISANDRWKSWRGYIISQPETKAPEEQPTVRTDTARLEGLRKLMGYVDNATDSPIMLFQDDATKAFHVRVGKTSPSVWGNSLRAAIDAAMDAERRG